MGDVALRLLVSAAILALFIYARPEGRALERRWLYGVAAAVTAFLALTITT